MRAAGADTNLRGTGKQGFSCETVSDIAYYAGLRLPTPSEQGISATLLIARFD